MSLLRSSVQLSILAVTFALAATACGSSSTAPTTPAADVTISIVGVNAAQSFSPNPTTMKVGQSVAFKNNDTIAHDATQDAAKFNTGTLGAGATSAAIAMPTAGTFTYHCSIHPGMIGTITVQ
ncbi:MAG TPA: cupredoxin domain-containing protein [Vicinamibacterales bacterium]|jgi:plastocyanin